MERMIDNEELIDKQYDVIAGRLPEKYNEVVLVVDKNNEINDYVLYSLGLLDPSSLNGIVRLPWQERTYPLTANSTFTPMMSFLT